MATHGFYVDVTPSERERQDQVAAAVTVIAEARAGIEQAKGMLMLQHHCDADTAFATLVAMSQKSHHKLIDVARGLVDAWSTGGIDAQA